MRMRMRTNPPHPLLQELHLLRTRHPPGAGALPGRHLAHLRLHDRTGLVRPPRLRLHWCAITLTF
eukprot:800623-Prorocentrum_minimum.AAC.2